MGKAKDIVLKPIPAKVANPFIKKNHYSGKIVNNSSLHFGCFYKGVLGGVLSYGPPLDKRKCIGFVKNTRWNDFLELNRMAMLDALPKNSESRCISVSIRLIKKNAPHVRWILSYSDGTQCGDGTIYRAAGFLLTDIKENANLAEMPDGTVIHKVTVQASPNRKFDCFGGKSMTEITGGKCDFDSMVKIYNGKILKGFQLRYIYLIDKTAQLNVPVLPYSKISEVGARMYKGKPISPAPVA